MDSITLGKKEDIARRPLLVAPHRKQNVIQRTGKAGLRKFIFRFWAPSASILTSEDSTSADLFRDLVSIEYQHLLKIVRAVFENTAIMCSGAHVNGFQFLSWNVQILPIPTQDG
jgi:hypothetical protein